MFWSKPNDFSDKSNDSEESRLDIQCLELADPVSILFSATGVLEVWLKSRLSWKYIYNKLSQVMQLVEHNTEVTEIVHCYQNEISNINNKIYTHLLLHRGRDEVVGHLW